MKVIEVKAAKEFAESFLPDIFFRMAVNRVLDNAPAANAVPADQYEALVEMYHELRENFIDYVCSGVSNPSPYCKNRCEGCVDSRGWCMTTDACKGFNPAEVILDEERRSDDG